jgi:hypothetical protein
MTDDVFCYKFLLYPLNGSNARYKLEEAHFEVSVCRNASNKGMLPSNGSSYLSMNILCQRMTQCPYKSHNNRKKWLHHSSGVLMLAHAELDREHQLCIRLYHDRALIHQLPAARLRIFAVKEPLHALHDQINQLVG